MQISAARRNPVLAFLLGFLFLAAAATPTRADDLKSDTTLGWVPSSVGFYASLLNLGETHFDRFMASNAYQRLKELPIVQMGLGQLTAQWEAGEGPFGEIKDFVADPENAGLVDLVKEAYREELFMFGDKNLAEFIYMLNTVNRANQKQQFAKLSGEEVGDENLMVEAAINAAESVDIPNFVMGFKVGDPSLAAAQIGRITALLRAAIEDNDELSQFMNDHDIELKEREINGSRFAQISLSGDMVPWDQIDSEDLSEDQVERLKGALGEKSVHFTFGAHEGYCLAVIGSINNPLRLFKSKKLLYDRPEMARLRKMDGKQFVSVFYASEEFMQKASRPKDDLDDVVMMANALLPQAQLEEEIETDLLSDIEELVDDFKKMIPETGAVAGFSYASEGGFEGYSENWGENLAFDGSKKLDILNHVGGNPLFVVAVRGKLDNPAKGFFSKWCSRSMSYVERFGMRNDPDEDALELYETFRDALVPFGKQFAEATREHWEPAMQDGQVAFILDSKLEAKTQWHPMMPAADEPLGMFEFAQVVGVADKGQLEKAFEKYRQIANDTIDKIKEVTRDNQDALMERLEGQAQMLPMVVAQLRLPTAQEGETDAGKMYYLSTLQQAGVDADIAPSMGWSDDVLVMANTPDAASRILANKSVEGPLAEQADRNLAVASHVNFAGLMDMAKPWVSYGLTIAAEQQDNEMISMAIPQVETILDVIKCLGEMSSVTYVEDDRMVTFHTQQLIDLE